MTCSTPQRRRREMQMHSDNGRNAGELVQQPGSGHLAYPECETIFMGFRTNIA